MNCPVPKCHEDFEKKLMRKANAADTKKRFDQLKCLLGKKLSKKMATFWFSTIGLPLIAGGLVVWAEYTPRSTTETFATNISVLQERNKTIMKDVLDIKTKLDSKMESYAVNISVLQERNKTIMSNIKEIKSELHLIRSGLDKISVYLIDSRGDTSW